MARSSDRDACAPSFEAFVADGSPGFHRLAFARTGSWAVAEDLVAEMLADAYRRWDVVGEYDDPVAWGRRALLNRSVSVWRRRRSERRAVGRLSAISGDSTSSDPTSEAAVASGLTDGPLWDCIRGLPGRQQQVVLLLWFEDLSVAEVADTLECAPDTVRTHWRRARAALAAALGDADEDAQQGDAV